MLLRALKWGSGIVKLALTTVKYSKEGLWELLGLDGKVHLQLNQTYVLQRPWVMWALGAD